MKFALSLGQLNPTARVAVTEEADRLGYDSVWIPEHLVLPVDMGGSPHAGHDHPPIPPELPVFDALMYLAYLAARTDRIRQFATDARDWGHPLMLRFDHEMNGWWFSFPPPLPQSLADHNVLYGARTASLASRLPADYFAVFLGEIACTRRSTAENIHPARS